MQRTSWLFKRPARPVRGIWASVKRRDDATETTRLTALTLARSRASRTSVSDVLGLQSAGNAAGDVADVQAHVFALGARERRSPQGRGGVDGPRKSRYDAERLYAGDRRIEARGGGAGGKRIVRN